MAPRPILPSGHRIEVVDCFRALAIAPVIAFHYSLTYVPAAPGRPTLFAPNDGPASLGWLGVELFFMISGFVIFMTLHNCRSIKEFALRRALRLYPPLILCALITFTLAPRIDPGWPPISLGSVFASLLLIPPLGHTLWVDQAYWSLQVEAVFYVWIGVLFFTARDRFLIAWLALMTVSTAVTAAWPASPAVLALGSPYLPFFSFGMAGYLRFSQGRLTRTAAILLAASALSYVILWRSRSPGVHLAIAAMVLLFEAFLRGWLGWLAVQPLTWLGRISYPLYLLHDVIGLSLLAGLGLARILSLAVAVLVVTGLAAAVHQWLERPLHHAAKGWVQRLVPG